MIFNKLHIIIKVQLNGTKQLTGGKGGGSSVPGGGGSDQAGGGGVSTRARDQHSLGGGGGGGTAAGGVSGRGGFRGTSSYHIKANVLTLVHFNIMFIL